MNENFIEVKEKLIDMYNFNKDIKVELTPCGVKPILDYIDSKDKEIERLNNIIDEFNEWLIGEKMMFYKSKDGERLIRYGETKSKWLELKEGEE